MLSQNYLFELEEQILCPPLGTNNNSKDHSWWLVNQIERVASHVQFITLFSSRCLYDCSIRERERATVMSNLLHSSLAGVKAFACAFYLPQQTAHKSNSGQNHFVAEPNVLWLFLILLTLSIHYPCPSTYLPTYPVLTNCFTYILYPPILWF